MLERVRSILKENKERETFLLLVGQHYPLHSDEYRLIVKAYDTTEDAFRGRTREGNGERYFEHLRCVALIVMEYLHVSDAKVIAAALLHDIVEDIPWWDQGRVAREFGDEIANYVWWVTKPALGEDGDKEGRSRCYHENLRRAPREALIIKLADRLHNMLDMWGVDPEKQRRKVQETQDFYLPLAVQQILLIHELESAIAEIMRSW